VQELEELLGGVGLRGLAGLARYYRVEVGVGSRDWRLGRVARARLGGG